MYVDIKSIFFELLSTNEHIFDFIQEHEVNGLCVIHNKTDEVWLDKKSIKKLSLENQLISNPVLRGSLFDVASLNSIKKIFSLKEEKPNSLIVNIIPFQDSYICNANYLSIIYNTIQFVIIAFGEITRDTNSLITNQRETQNPLINSLEKNANNLVIDLLNNTKIQLWAFDGETYHYMNKEWFEYTGQNPDRPLTIERWTERLHPDDLPQATEIWLKHFEKKVEHENYFKLKRHDGIYRSFYCKVIPVWDKKGKFIYFQGHNIDITDRLEAEAALKESEERLKLSIDAAGVGLWDWDFTTHKITYNENWTNIIGYTLDEFSKFTTDVFHEIIHPEDLPKLQNNLDAHLKGETEYFECELRMKHKKGHWIWTFDRGSVSEIDKVGRPIRMTGTHVDINDRKLVEKELRESKERLTLSVEAANVGLWDWYLPTNEIKHNEKWANIIGYTLKEITPITDEIFEQLMHPEDLPILMEKLNKHIKGATEYFEHEIRMKHKEGHWVWILDRGKIVERDHEGKPVRMSGTHIDITERKLAEQTIRENEARLHKLTRNVPGVIYQYEMTPDNKTYFSFMSDGLAKVNKDVHPEKVMISPEAVFESIIHPEDKDAFYKAIQTSKESLSPFNVNYRVVKSNGTIKWHNASSKPEKQEDGTIIWYGIFRDITDTIESKKERERLAQIAENTSDMLITTDKDGRVTWANNIHKKIMGIDPKDIIGKKPTEKLRAPEKYKNKILKLEDALVNHKLFNDVLFLYSEEDKPIWINYTVTPIFKEDGTFLYSIVNKTNVSELIHQQKELKRLLKMSSDQNDRLKEYSYITSHNIRSNVSSILGLTNLLLEEPSKPLFLEKLQVAANQLDITIRNITALLHLEKDYSIEDKAIYNLSDGLERIIGLNQNLINEKQAIITLQQTDAIIINTVPAYIDSIIQNLLTNALKYGVTEDNKEIVIKATLKNDILCLVVKDFGLGMNLNKYGHKLFLLGARFHKIEKGDGIGLYMTYRQIEALKGKIKVESKENKGSSFIVELPL